MEAAPKLVVQIRNRQCNYVVSFGSDSLKADMPPLAIEPGINAN